MARTGGPSSRHHPRLRDLTRGAFLGAALTLVHQALQDAVFQNGIGDFGTAETILARGLEVVAELEGTDRIFWQARLLITRAFTRFERDGVAAALADLDEARRLSTRIGARQLLGLCHIQESNLHARGTHWTEAVAAATAAEDLLDTMEPEQRFALLLNRGFARQNILDTTGAEQDLRRSLAIADELGQPELRFKAIHNLGCLAHVEGDLPKALALMQEADDLPVVVTRDRVRLDHAQVLIEAGLVDRARDLLERTLATAEEARHPLEQSEIHLDLARCAVHDDDIDRARSHVRAAMDRYAGRGTTQLERRAELVLAHVDLAAGEHLDEVERIARDWLDGRADAGDERIATRLLVEVALAHGALDEAGGLLNALSRRRDQAVSADLHESLLRARLAHARGDRRASVAVLRAASARLARHQGQAQSLEVRAALALHAKRLVRFDVTSALATGSAPAVFASVERWRATSHRASALHAPEDPETAALVRRLRHTRLVAPETTGADVRALEQRIAHREWASPRHAATGASRPVRLSEVRREVSRRGVVVVELFTADGVLHAVVIAPGHTRLVRLGPSGQAQHWSNQLALDLRGLAVAPVPALRFALRGAVEDSRTQLDDLVLAPLEPWLGTGPVVLVPPRGLSTVPWGSLPTLHGRPVSVAQSVSAWLRRLTDEPLNEARTDSTSETASGLRTGLTNDGRPVSVAALAGTGLPHALEEAAAIDLLWGSRPAAATPRAPDPAAAVITALAERTIVHIAAHGHHEEQNALFSSLRMADGPVFAHEFPRPLATELVVLSACDVGQSDVRPGDEPLGMTAALLALGVGCVVASVAPVPDADAQAAMAAFHGRLVHGIPASVALAEAMTQVPAAEAFCVYGGDWSLAARLR